MVLEHGSISRKQAMIACDGRHFFIADLGSTHGTKVNGKKLVPEELIRAKNGMEVHFGHSTRCYVFQGLDLISPTDSSDGPTAEAPAKSANSTVDTESSLAESDLPLSFIAGKRSQKSGGDREKGACNFKTYARTGAAGNRTEREAAIKAATASFLGPALPPDLEWQRKKALRQGSGGTADEGRDPLESTEPGASAAPQDNADDDDDSDSQVTKVAVSTAMERWQKAQDEAMRSYQLPVTHELVVTEKFPHLKSVSCIAIDQAGARMATGSYDNYVRMWDFHGMGEARKPFREFEPMSGHAVVGLDYSPSGDKMLVATGEARCKVVDRNAVLLLQFRKGDPYLHDMARTEGHISGVSGCVWSPGRTEQVLTCARDSTVRVWDLNGKTHFDELINFQVIKHKCKAGRRTGVSTLACSEKLIASGCEDGSIQLWARNKAKYTRPKFLVREAHDPAAGAGGICSLSFNADGNLLASRAPDGRLRLWDIRRFREPLMSVAGLRTAAAGAGCAFDKDGLLLATTTASSQGASADLGGAGQRTQGGGQVLFFDIQRDSGAPVYRLELGEEESGVALAWHHTVNQIAIGTASGHTRMFFSPRYSVKGALQVAGKRPKPRNNGLDVGFGVQTAEAIGGVVAGVIMNPHALPMYRDPVSEKGQRKLDRQDPNKSREPYHPATGPQHVRYVSKSHNFTQMMIKERKAKGSDNFYLDKDARAELLKFAHTTKEDDNAFTGAWANTTTKFMARTAEQEALDVKKADEEYLKNH